MRFVTACALVLSLVACGSGGDDGDGNGVASTALSVIGKQTADFCRKADACNALHNTSVDECTGSLDRILNNALPAEAHDVGTMMDKCVQMEACKNFVTCAQAIGTN